MSAARGLVGPIHFAAHRPDRWAVHKMGDRWCAHILPRQKPAVQFERFEDAAAYAVAQATLSRVLGRLA